MQPDEKARRVNNFSVRKNSLLGRAARVLASASSLAKADKTEVDTRAMLYSTLTRARSAREKFKLFIAELPNVPYSKVARKRNRLQLKFVLAELEDSITVIEETLWPERAAGLDAANDLDELMASHSSIEKED